MAFPRLATSTLRRLVPACLIGVLLTITLLVVVLRSGNPLHTDEPGNLQSQSAKSASPTTETPDNEPSADVTKTGQLASQVSDFLTAYYRLEPTDTYDSRLQRMNNLHPAVPSKVLDGLSLDPITGTQADEVRIQQGIVIQAKVFPESMISEPVDQTDPNVVDVTISVSVEQHWPDGHVESFDPEYVGMSWQYESGVWQIISFDETDETVG